jgi:hypothetical protein
MEKNVFSVPSLSFLMTGIVLILLPLAQISPDETIIIGVVNLLAFAAIYFEKLKLYNPFIRIGVSIFNIIIFSYQLYISLAYCSFGLSINVIATLMLSVVFLVTYLAILLFYSRT